MAAKKDTQEAVEPIATPQEESPGKGGSKLMMILLIPLILLPAAGGAYFAYRTFGPQPTPAEIAAKEQVEKTKAKESEAAVHGEFMQIENMIINPAGTNGQRYLMISIGLECIEATAMEELKAKEVVVKDTILKVLSERSVEELASVGLRSSLKEKVRTAVNGVLSNGQVDRLYFTQYILQ